MDAKVAHALIELHAQEEAEKKAKEEEKCGTATNREGCLKANFIRRMVC